MLADNFGTYLLGVAAGLMTKTGEIEFIGGVPIAFVLGSYNAFHLGARAVDPKQGCDVIGSHRDSPIAVAQTAEAVGAFLAGYPSLAVQKFCPNAWVTGLSLTWGGFFGEIAQQVLDGTWKPAHVRRGIEAGFITLGEFGPRVPEEVKKIVLAYKEKLILGELQPFAGPIRDRNGTRAS